MKDKNLDEIIKYYKSGKLIIAEKKLSELMKKFPNNYFLYNLFGAILAGQKKMDEAIIYYEKSIKISPNYADTYNNLAGILADQKKYLFNNRKTLIEFEKFLIESHQAAQHGKKLKDGSVFKTK